MPFRSNIFKSSTLFSLAACKEGCERSEREACFGVQPAAATQLLALVPLSRAHLAEHAGGVLVQQLGFEAMQHVDDGEVLLGDGVLQRRVAPPVLHGRRRMKNGAFSQLMKHHRGDTPSWGRAPAR